MVDVVGRIRYCTFMTGVDNALNSDRLTKRVINYNIFVNKR